jgi:hypothetical protein
MQSPGGFCDRHIRDNTMIAIGKLTAILRRDT